VVNKDIHICIHLDADSQVEVTQV